MDEARIRIASIKAGVAQHATQQARPSATSKLMDSATATNDATGSGPTPLDSGTSFAAAVAAPIVASPSAATAAAPALHAPLAARAAAELTADTPGHAPAVACTAESAIVEPTPAGSFSAEMAEAEEMAEVVRFYVNSKQWWDLVINQVPQDALEGHRR